MENPINPDVNKGWLIIEALIDIDINIDVDIYISLHFLSHISRIVVYEGYTGFYIFGWTGFEDFESEYGIMEKKKPHKISPSQPN